MGKGLALYPKRKGEGLIEAAGNTTVLTTLMQTIAQNTIKYSTTFLTSASTTRKGIIEIATIAETNTGTDATRAVSPDGLSGSIHGEKLVYLKVLAYGTALTTGDGKMYFTIPDSLNGMNLVDADATVYTASSSGTPTIQIYNVTGTNDMLSTEITLDENELTSYTATNAVVIDTDHDDVVTGDVLRIDVDVAGTDTTGLDVILTFQTP